MERFEDMVSIDPATVERVDADTYRAILKALRGRRFAYVRVQKGVIMARFERPGDDREMVRSPESCFAGDVIQIEMNDNCKHMQTHEEISYLVANGTLAPASRVEFDKAPNWEEQRKASIQAAKAKQRTDASMVVSLNERVVNLEHMFKRMLATAQSMEVSSKA